MPDPGYGKEPARRAVAGSIHGISGCPVFLGQHRTWSLLARSDRPNLRRQPLAVDLPVPRGPPFGLVAGLRALRP